ncbi:hypothetical protein ABE083_30840 [Bacillus mycoides]
MSRKSKCQDLYEDSNVAKLDDYQLNVDEIDDIKDSIREISNTGGGIT